MKQFTALALIFLGFIIWPLTTQANYQTATRLTPTPPCNTVTQTPIATPTMLIASLDASTLTDTTSLETETRITPTPSPTLPPCNPSPPCPPVPTAFPLTPTFTPTPTSSPCPTITPTPWLGTSTPSPTSWTTTPSATPCYNTPTAIPPTPTPWETPTPTSTHTWPTPTAVPCYPSPTPWATTPSATPCYNTPTAMPPSPTPWETPTPTATHTWPTATAIPCYPSPTPWVVTPPATPNTATPVPTAYPVFTATVSVIPQAPLVATGDILTVTITVDVNEGCQFPVFELTLSQVGDDNPSFAPAESVTIGPPMFMPQTVTFTAVTSGTTTFDALLFGERYCGDGWIWTYAGGQSIPVTVIDSSPPLKHLYMPLIRQD